MINKPRLVRDKMPDFRRCIFLTFPFIFRKNLILIALLQEKYSGVLNLIGVDLRQADICRTVLDDSNFSEAKISWANLATARAERAIFRKANLQNTYLSGINLSYADISGADLSRAILLRPDLRNANLSEAILSHSILVGCTEFRRLKCRNTVFDGAIIDNEKLIDHLTEHKAAEPILCAITELKRLKLSLKKKGFNSKIIEKMLERSLIR